MEQQTTSSPEPRVKDELGDETFMSAEDLRNYMAEMQIARAMKASEGGGRGDKAREELIKRMREPIDLGPERLKEIVQSLKTKLRSAAERGNTELMVMRFPVAVCTDKGRAVNNADADWPDTLTGRPRQAYELWRDHLQPAGFKLSAMIVEWPGGMPGDVGFFLKWGESKH